MTENERKEALMMRQRLVTNLAMIHEPSIAYPHDASDDYRFLIRKAIYYQELIDRFKRQPDTDNG